MLPIFCREILCSEHKGKLIDQETHETIDDPSPQTALRRPLPGTKSRIKPKDSVSPESAGPQPGTEKRHKIERQRFTSGAPGPGPAWESSMKPKESQVSSWRSQETQDGRRAAEPVERAANPEGQRETLKKDMP